MKSSAISESGRLSIEELIQLGLVQSRKQTLLETLLKHTNSGTTDPAQI
jgi:hypothetical protein